MKLAERQRFGQLEHCGHVFASVREIVIRDAVRVQEKFKHSQGAEQMALRAGGTLEAGESWAGLDGLTQLVDPF